MIEQGTNKRIVKNTLMLYFRQILIMLVSLYTVRVVLEVLGIEDFGIYNVVAGLVTFCSFLSGAMTSVSQRFFSFAIGGNNSTQLNKTFSVNIILFALVALVAVVLLETVGLWFVYNKLNVPPERFTTVCWIYHFSVLTFIITILASPFMSIIIAYEDMHVYAYISIAEVILKLVVVFLLKIINADKLQIYGILIFIVAGINASFYIIYCIRSYGECQFKRLYWDSSFMRDTLGYTTWTIFGQLTSVIRNQGITILINQYFNALIVASRSIALSVGNYANVFASNFNTGLYPSIIKEYAAGNKKRMFSLVYSGSKVSFYLMWLITLPLFLEMDGILSIWLKNPPEYAVLFTKFALFDTLVNSTSLSLATAARAPGKMKMYEMPLGFIQIIIFLISYIFLHLGFDVSTVFFIGCSGSIVMFLFRIVVLNKFIGLSISGYVYNVLLPISVVTLVSAVPLFCLSRIVPAGLLWSAIFLLFCVVLTSLVIYCFGLSRDNRKSINLSIQRKFKGIS